MQANVAKAREAHKASRALALEASTQKQLRDQLVRAVRREDPDYWTYERIAASLGCSKELVAKIIQER